MPSHTIFAHRDFQVFSLPRHPAFLSQAPALLRPYEDCPRYSGPRRSPRLRRLLPAGQIAGKPAKARASRPGEPPSPASGNRRVRAPVRCGHPRGAGRARILNAPVALKSTAIGAILLLQFRRIFCGKVVAPVSQLGGSSARALEGGGIDA